MKALKPVLASYPQELKTLGDHLRKKRLDLKLLQREVAQRLGVNKASIYNWENNRTSPSLYSIPKIIKFLGYIPYDTPTKTLGEKIVTFRRFLGLSQKKLARYLDIDPSTLGRWERGKNQPLKEHLEKLTDFFTSFSPDARGPEE